MVMDDKNKLISTQTHTVTAKTTVNQTQSDIANAIATNNTTANDLVDKSDSRTISSTNNNKSVSNPELSIIPVSSEKIAWINWKKYQTQMAPVEKWRSHYLNGGYVGVICGKINGNIECIDIDVKNDPDKRVYEDYKKIIPQDLFDRLLIQSTVNYGFHIIYICPDENILPTKKLAHSKTGEVIIETRSEASYFCHHLQDYNVIQGKFDLENYEIEIPVITKEERELLMELARGLDRKPLKSSFKYKEKGIDKFNTEFDPIPLFLKHDWTVYKEDQEKIYLTRPDSNAPYSGYYYLDSNLFICFSTSTDFKAMQVHNNFQILKVLEGGNDNSKTMKLLPSLGFEISSTSNRIGTKVVADFLNNKGLIYDSFRQKLVFNQKPVDDNLVNSLYLELCEMLERDLSKDKFNTIINSNYIHTINPVLEYVKSNSGQTSTGHLEKWVDCIELSPYVDKDIVLHFFTKWYVGMIAMAFDDYTFSNEFFLTILSQSQGIGKTTMLRNCLLPHDLKKLMAEHSLTSSNDYKVLLGDVLIMLDDELDGNSYKKSQTFKNLCSTKINTARKPYAMHHSNIIRRASLCGSGNSLKIIKEKEERRYIPIAAEDIYWDKLKQLDLDKMFMEGYSLLQSSYKYSYQPEEDRKLLNILYENHRQENDIDLILKEMVDLPVDDDVFYITNLDILNALSNLYPNSTRRINSPTIGRLLSEMGFQSKRLGKKRIVCYLISGQSKIIEHLSPNAQSWQIKS
jgi:hypothetical protein